MLVGAQHVEPRSASRPFDFGRYGAAFEEGLRAEFLLISEDTAQMRTSDGHVVAYERSDEPLIRRLYN